MAALTYSMRAHLFLFFTHYKHQWIFHRCWFGCRVWLIKPLNCTIVFFVFHSSANTHKRSQPLALALRLSVLTTKMRRSQIQLGEGSLHCCCAQWQCCRSAAFQSIETHCCCLSKCGGIECKPLLSSPPLLALVHRVNTKQHFSLPFLTKARSPDSDWS